MRRLKHGLGFLALAAGAAFAMPATATTWLSSGATGTTTEMSMVVGGQTVKVRAYSTQTPSAVGTVASTAGNFAHAQVNLYSGGFGITNQIPGDANEGNAPEHAIDNNQIFDALVFELPSSGFDLQAFRLGWATEGYTATDPYTGEADIAVYFGGNSLGANYDFTKACFTGCTGTAKALTGTGGLGFTDITGQLTRADTNAAIAAGNDNNVPVNTFILDNNPTPTGQYLIMTGALGGTNDNFKVDLLKATPGGPGGAAPEPGTIALLGLGLFGLVALKRRRLALA